MMGCSVETFHYKSKTQRAAILRPLLDAKGAWVPLPELLALGVAQYNARIHELRALGFQIENKTERDASGVVHSWYRLLTSPAPPAPEPSKVEASKAEILWQDRQRLTGLPLFDSAVRP